MKKPARFENLEKGYCRLQILVNIKSRPRAINTRAASCRNFPYAEPLICVTMAIDKKGGSTLRRWLFVFALGLVAAGVWRDEHKAVLAKAARVCMECIGLG